MNILEVGIQKGMERGELLKLISQVRKKEQKGLSAEETADLLEEDTDTIRQMYEAILEHRDYSDEQIVSLIKK